MIGKSSPINYIRSFKWQPGMGNKFAWPSTGKSYKIPLSALKSPTINSSAIWRIKVFLLGSKNFGDKIFSFNN